MSSEHSQKTLIEAWAVLLRYRWRFVLPAFLTLVLALAVSLLLPRKYQGEAIFERRLDMVLAEIMQRGGQKPVQDPRQTLVQELTGPPAIERVVSLIAPQFKDNPALDEAALKAELPRRLIVKFDIATNSLDRVRLTYSSEDPQLARTVVNTLVTDYIERTRADIDRQLRQSESFFETEVEHSRQEIEELENRKLTYEIEHAALLPDTPQSIQTMTQEAADELAKLEQQLATVDLRLEALQGSIKGTPKTTPSVVMARNPEVAQLENKLKELNSTLTLYTSSYKMTDKHPDLQDLRAQIAQIQQRIGGLPQDVVKEQHHDTNPKVAELELMLTEATTERRALVRQVVAAKARLAEFNKQSEQLFPVRAEYRKLTRQVEQSQRQLAFWEDNLRRVRMALTAETGNRGVQMDFIKPCPVVSRPISPDPWQALAAAIAVSLTIGALSVFIAHRTDEAFRDGDQLAAAFQLPLMGSVSQIISQQERRFIRLRRLVFYPLNAAAMAAVVMFMVGLVYLHLRQPQQFARFTENPMSFVTSQVFGQAEPSNRE